MRTFSVIIIFLLTFASRLESVLMAVTCISTNDAPIIGILEQEVTTYVKSRYPDADTYIAASYVKFIEGAGGRVVPIKVGRSRIYYETMMNRINGVLLPGGAANFTAKNGYSKAVSTIYDIAKVMNDQGQHFPILGICLGFETLIYTMTGYSVTSTRPCNCPNDKFPLIFETGYKNSKLFGNMPDIISDWLSTKNLTYNSHNKCVTKQILRDHGIADSLRVLTTNTDPTSRLRFISSVEWTDYPFYGLQFHPEKNLYEWKVTENIPHGFCASRVSQYFANFFVNEARQNSNKFPNSEVESEYLIYNYQPTYTGLKNILFQQCYFFQKP